MKPILPHPNLGGIADAGLTQDIARALVGGGEARGLGRRQELEQRLQSTFEIQRYGHAGGAHGLEGLGGGAAIQAVAAQAFEAEIPELVERVGVALAGGLLLQRLVEQRAQVEIELAFDQDAQHGSLLAVGFWPIAKMPARVSSLSARATIRPAFVDGIGVPCCVGR